MTMADIERHPLEPFLPDNARLLMLGSFPPARHRWSMDFFYPNYINDMWRLFGLIFLGDKNALVDEEARTFRRDDIIRLLREKGIGLYDAARAVVRTKNTASDKDLEIVEETDVEALLRLVPTCEAVAATGQKAADVVARRFGVETPRVGQSVKFVTLGREIRLYRMPSSSRAYPMSIANKAARYEAMFRYLGMI